MKTWIIRPATTKMLAALYGVSRGIITKHIELLGDKVGKTGNYWMVNQVIAIIDNLGPPPDCKVIYPKKK